MKVQSKINSVCSPFFFSQQVSSRFCGYSLTAVANFIQLPEIPSFSLPWFPFSSWWFEFSSQSPHSHQSPGPLTAWAMTSFSPPVAMAAPGVGKTVAFNIPAALCSGRPVHAPLGSHPHQRHSFNFPSYSSPTAMANHPSPCQPFREFTYTH